MFCEIWGGRGQFSTAAGKFTSDITGLKRLWGLLVEKKGGGGGLIVFSGFISRFFEKKMGGGGWIIEWRGEGWGGGGQ